MLPRRAFLGAALPGDAQAFVDGGVKIAGVAPGGLADRAGMTGGDLLVSLAGMPVKNLCELSAALRRAGHASTVELEFVRGGARELGRATVVEQPLEELEGVTYAELAVDGARLRTITTGVTAPRALIAVLQGIACESIDQVSMADTPLAGLIAGWAHARFDSFRFDKRGVGDSEGGPCRELAFDTELGDARLALGRAREIARTRGIPLVVFGHSVGGIMAAVLASELDLGGVIVYGTPVMRWLDCLRDSVRRQLELQGAPTDERSRHLASLDDLTRSGELNGRSATYHAELEAIDIEAAWRAVTTDVLVVRGEHDWVVRDDDQARIAALARGRTTIVDVPGLDHLFGAHTDRAASLRDYGAGAFDPVIVHATVDWLEHTLRPGGVV